MEVIPSLLGNHMTENVDLYQMKARIFFCASTSRLIFNINE